MRLFWHQPQIVAYLQDIHIREVFTLADGAASADAAPQSAAVVQELR